MGRMMSEYSVFINGMNAYEIVKLIGEREFRERLERKAICGKGMFNDQIGLMLDKNLPLSFTYKYGGGSIGISSDGRVLVSKGYDEDLTEEFVVGELEEIFEAPLERVESRVVA